MTDTEMDGIRRRAAERAAKRSPQWQSDYDRLMALDDGRMEIILPPEPLPPPAWPEEQRAQFVEALAVDEGFRGAIRAWIGGAE